MMIHEKLMSGQFLQDFKKNRSSLLQTSTATHQHQQPLHHLQLQSPTIPTLDIYSAYVYQQHLQQQLLGSAVHPPSLPYANHSPQSAEVLDLSRHNSAELPPKTPSPYQTSSSLSTDSPIESPTNLMPQPSTAPTATSLLPANLLYAAQVQQQFQNTNSLHIPANLATLYPGLYYPNVAKQEAMNTTVPQVNVTIPTPVVTNNVLQTFASATTVAATSTLKHDPAPEPNSQKQQQQENQQPQQSTDIPIPTSSISSTISTTNMSSIDVKNTRPFKAFPRDPLVIAANFAATDVLLDNPRVERYTEYRKRVLEQIRSSNGGSRTVTNPKMRRTNSASGNIHEGSSSTNSENDERNIEESSDCDSNFDNENQSGANNKTSENSNTNNNTTITSSASIVKDAAYYERRRKNNAAAKKSRDRRRIKEDEIAIRAAYLERQNIELLCQIDALKAQLAALTSKIP